MDTKHLEQFFNKVDSDSRLTVSHMGLLAALIRLAYMQKENKVIRVSRSKLMKLSHMRSPPTFHRYFKELQDYGYITYIPSYHPGFRSTVTFNTL